MPAQSADADGFGFRPLYRQVRDKLIRRLVDGVWQPGGALPSEMQLAAELGVSQGTVRKALDTMAAENLVVRRQGRGTFVARHDEERIMFQFFKLVGDDGVRSFPQSRVLRLSQGQANAAERDLLRLETNSRVIRIRRLRSINGEPVIAETISLPEALFPEIAEMELPNNLYGFYAMRFGISITNTREKLRAIAAPQHAAAALGTKCGSPLLQISRVALSLKRIPVEWRLSYCLTEEVHYLSDLR